MARAGFDITEAAQIWRDMALEHPDAIQTYAAASHPGTAERYVLMEETVDEILEKNLNSKDLVPNYVR